MSKTKTTLFQQLQDESVKLTIEKKSWRTVRGIRLSLIVLTPLLCAVFFPAVTKYLLQIGDNQQSVFGHRWQNETLIAQTSFPLLKSEEQLRSEVQAAINATPPVFRTKARQSLQAERVRDEICRRMSQVSQSTDFRNRVRDLCVQCNRTPLINFAKNSISTREISVMPTPTSLETVTLTSVLDSAEVQYLVDQQCKDYLNAQQLNQLGDELLKYFSPTLEFWSEKTDKMKAASAENVPRTLGLVHKGDVIVARGDFVNEEVFVRLRSYGAVREERDDQTHSLMLVAGNVLHAALIVCVMVLFLFFLRRKIYSDNLQLVSVMGMIVLSAFLGWISMRIAPSYAAEYLVLIPALAMITAIYFDSRTGFILTVTASLMFAAVRSNDMSAAFAQLFAGTLAAYSVRDLRSRTQLFRSMAFISVGFLLVIVSTTLEQGSGWTSMVSPMLSAVINAVLSPLVTFAVIALSERFFGVMTDLSLREFDNVNHPLLIEMSEKAPGTYQHTLAIANLVESAAYAIGASPLLARIGAYFHDIGKIPKAEYFIENQIELVNKHDSLSPKKSATIIRNHVEDGLELAREYSLPDRIADFIPMHHGTTLIKHFYAKAVDSMEQDGVALTEEQFRYPGPKPNSKETALVMLADGVEAISRTVDDRDELEASINKIFREKMLDGQLDECDLTMKDINTVREVFLRNLVGAHHQRIQYKELPNANAANS